MNRKTGVDNRFIHSQDFSQDHSDRDKMGLNNSHKTNEKLATMDQTDSIFTIRDFQQKKLILKTFGDDEKNRIINAVIDQSKTILDIYESCKIPQTSGYRKIRELIRDGFLVVDGYETIPYGIKKVRKFISIFKSITIQIQKNTIIIQVQFKEGVIKKNKKPQMSRLKGQQGNTHVDRPEIASDIKWLTH